jgi:hypothetical protein
MKELSRKFEKSENLKPFIVTDGQLIISQHLESAASAPKKVIEILRRNNNKNND